MALVITFFAGYFAIRDCSAFEWWPKLTDGNNDDVTFEHVWQDMEWFRSLVTSHSAFHWLSTCEESMNSFYQTSVPSSFGFTDYVNNNIPHSPIIDYGLDSCSVELQDMLKATFIFDNEEINWLRINAITWILFFVNFILTFIFGLKTIWSRGDDNIADDSYKPRRKPLFPNHKRKRGKRKRKSISPPRRHRLCRQRQIPGNTIQKQLHQQYKSGAGILTPDNKANDIFKIRKSLYPPSPSRKKESKSSLNKSASPKSSPRKATPIGKIYDLDNAENIPWDILDILLCIRSPCFEHDHDHICVVGNHVYTIPNWSVPNTSSPTSVSPSPNVSEFINGGYDYDGVGYENNYGAGDGVHGFDDFEDEDALDNDELVRIYENVQFEKDVTERTTLLEPIVTEPPSSGEQSPTTVGLSECEENESPIIDITDAIGVDSVGNLEDDVFIEDFDLSERNVIKDHLVSAAAKMQENVQHVVESVRERGRNFMDNFYPDVAQHEAATSPDDRNHPSDRTIDEDDIGHPCANSSFKSDVDSVYEYNRFTRYSYTDEHEVSWLEETETETDKSSLLSSRSSFNEVDFNISKYLHNLSLRLSKESQCLHELNKTMSFYGDVSVLELGASWLVRSLLNHVIDDLNISSTLQSYQESVTVKLRSVLNNTR